MTAIKFEKYPMHFNVTDSIAKIGKMIKDEILASTGILSFWGREIIKLPGLGTDFG